MATACASVRSCKRVISDASGSCSDVANAWRRRALNYFQRQLNQEFSLWTWNQDTWRDFKIETEKRLMRSEVLQRFASGAPP